MFKKNTKGMSYVEIVIVISIIAIMTMLTVANLRGSGTSGLLFVSAQKLITDIHRAQTYALSAMLFGEVAPVSPAGGWGIYFNKNRDHYTIFADLEESPFVGFGNYYCLNECSDTSGEAYQQISLPEGAVIDKIYKVRASDGVILPATQMNIVFEPPDPIIHLCETAGDCDYSQVGIVIITDMLDKREVTVNFFGLIDTKEVYY